MGLQEARGHAEERVSILPPSSITLPLPLKIKPPGSLPSSRYTLYPTWPRSPIRPERHPTFEDLVTGSSSSSVSPAIILGNLNVHMDPSFLRSWLPCVPILGDLLFISATHIPPGNVSYKILNFSIPLSWTTTSFFSSHKTWSPFTEISPIPPFCLAHSAMGPEHRLWTRHSARLSAPSWLSSSPIDPPVMGHIIHSPWHPRFPHPLALPFPALEESGHLLSPSGFPGWEKAEENHPTVQTGATPELWSLTSA